MKKILLTLGLITSILQITAMPPMDPVAVTATIIANVAIAGLDLNTNSIIENNRGIFPQLDIETYLGVGVAVAAGGLYVTNNEHLSYAISGFTGMYVIARRIALNNAINEQAKRKKLARQN